MTLKLNNHKKVAAMLKQQNERIAVKCAQLSQERDNALREARIEKDLLKDLLKDFKKQHSFCRCLLKKHLRQTIADIKVNINTHMQNSRALLNKRNILECSCLYI